MDDTQDSTAIAMDTIPWITVFQCRLRMSRIGSLLRYPIGFPITNPMGLKVERDIPKMEVLNLIRLFLGWVFPYQAGKHTAYITF